MKTRLTALSCFAFALSLSSACEEDKAVVITTDAAAPAGDGGAKDGGATDAAATDGVATDAAATDAAAIGDASAAGDAPGPKLASSTGAWVVFPDPLGAGVANPAMNIMGSADAFEISGTKTLVVLKVTGMPASTTFGSHLHKLGCADSMAGGHYQHNPPADGGSANDPTVANAMNEVWLDFTTDASGAATVMAMVDWKPRPGEAKAIVVHAMKTGDGGLAGAKLACLNMPF
jgi:Cu-Zn family superoxide dismutase